MGKSNFYLYGVKGKVGNLVAQKGVKGGTTLRSYVVPKNPKTRRQIAQRIVFATVTQASRVLKPLINHSFEGVAYGNDSVNRFRSLNLKKLRTLAAKDFADTPKAADAQCFFTTQGIRSIIPNQYIVSSGSLTDSALSVAKAGQPSVGAIDGELYIKVAGDADLSLLATVSGGAVTVTLGQLLKTFFGITALNEQISVCMIVNTSTDYQFSYNDDSAAGFQIPYTQYNVQRLVMRSNVDFNETFTVGNISGGTFTPVESVLEHLAEFVLGAFDPVMSAEPFMSVMENILRNFYTFDYDTDTNYISLSITDGFSKPLNNLVSDDCAVVAAGFVRSRLVEGSWQRSNCSLTLATPTEGAYNNFGLLWSFAVDAWLERGAIASDDRYLNEGGSEDQLGENF